MTDIRLVSSSKKSSTLVEGDVGNLMTPGDIITADSGFMR